MRLLAVLLLLGLTVALAAQAPTHYVTANGNASSNCTMGDPCTFTRAFELGDTATIPCDSVVSVAAGYYVQAELVWGTSKNCGIGSFVKFIGDTGAVVTGLETKPSAASFSLTTSQTYTYEISWDETSTFTVGLVAQQGNPSTWASMTLEDRNAGVQLPAKYEVESPVNYTKRASIAEVEVHRCTFWNDTTANKVYVHMCHNGAPATADDLYFGRSRWGQVIVQGDDLWWQNIDVQHASLDLGVGFLIESTADRTNLTESYFRAASVESGGNGSVIADIVIEHVLTQGPAAEGCRDEDSNTVDATARSCFNTNGQGTGMLIGINDSTASANQTISFVTIKKNWNGAHVAGDNTLTASTLWGHHNHSLTFSGDGATITSVVSANAQDSLSANGLAWDNVTIENNLFLHEIVTHVTYAQEDMGPAATTAWTFRNNILPAWLLEEKTIPGLTASCNLFIEDLNGEGVDVVSLDVAGYAGTSFSYGSFAAFLTGQPTLATNSLGLLIGKWTDGTQFANFVSQEIASFSFVPASHVSQAVTMPGCSRVGPFDGPAAPAPVRLRLRA